MRPLVTGLVFLGLILHSAPAQAQLDGTRVYWPLPKNMNVLGVHVVSGTVNATYTNLQRLEPSLNIDNQLYVLSYSRSQPVLGRSFVVTATLPAGIIKTDSALPIGANDPFVHGVGDPSLGATINIFGAPGLMLREYARYDLKTVVSLNVNATFPLGQYNEDEALNVGSNQTRVRVSVPMVHSLGAWVAGDRTTIEVTPSLTWFTENGNSMGATVKQDPLAAIESHVTRDITRKASLSIDYSYIRFGESTRTDNESGSVTGSGGSSSSHLLGLTVNFAVNDNLTLYATHMQTLQGESSPVALEGALFRVSLLWSFHRVIERRRAFMD